MPARALFRHLALGALIAVAVLGATACGDATSTTAPTPASTTSGPRLEVDPEAIDFGPIPQTSPVEKTLTLANVGDDTLVIEKLKST